MPSIKESVSALLVISLTGLWFYQQLVPTVPVTIVLEVIVFIFAISAGIVTFGAGVMEKSFGIVNEIRDQNNKSTSDTDT